MSWKVLIVELETQDYVDTWSEVFAPSEGYEVVYASNVDDAKVILTKGDVACLIHVALDDSQDLT